MVAWFIFLQHKYYAFVAWKKGSVVFMSIQLVIVVVYITLLFGISLWVKHKADSGSTAFLLAGRKLNTILVAVNVTGLAVGAASTVGVAQRAFSVGLAAGWYNGAWSIGAIVMGLLAAGKLRSMKVSTIPEFFEFYYDTKGRAIAAIGLVIIMCVITALQYHGRRCDFVLAAAGDFLLPWRYDYECRGVYRYYTDWRFFGLAAWQISSALP